MYPQSSQQLHQGQQPQQQQLQQGHHQQQMQQGHHQLQGGRLMHMEGHGAMSISMEQRPATAASELASTAQSSMSATSGSPPHSGSQLLSAQNPPGLHQFHQGGPGSQKLPGHFIQGPQAQPPANWPQQQGQDASASARNQQAASSTSNRLKMVLEMVLPCNVICLLPEAHQEHMRAAIPSPLLSSLANLAGFYCLSACAACEVRFSGSFLERVASKVDHYGSAQHYSSVRDFLAHGQAKIMRAMSPAEVRIRGKSLDVVMLVENLVQVSRGMAVLEASAATGSGTSTSGAASPSKDPPPGLALNPPAATSEPEQQQQWTQEDQAGAEADASGAAAGAAASAKNPAEQLSAAKQLFHQYVEQYRDNIQDLISLLDAAEPPAGSQQQQQQQPQPQQQQQAAGGLGGHDGRQFKGRYGREARAGPGGSGPGIKHGHGQRMQPGPRYATPQVAMMPQEQLAPAYGGQQPVQLVHHHGGHAYGGQQQQQQPAVLYQQPAGGLELGYAPQHPGLGHQPYLSNAAGQQLVLVQQVGQQVGQQPVMLVHSPGNGPGTYLQGDPTSMGLQYH